MKNAATTLRLLALALACGALPAAARAAAPAAPGTSAAAGAKPGTAPQVSVSTAPPPSPAQIYTAERLRDPFSPAGSSASGGRSYSLETDFNIHNLSLRGVMKDPAADYALFSDSSFGVSFILRNGKLYDSRNKVVPGVTGKLKTRQKWAQLETVEHDVQVFRLGEEEKD